jgi:hypothetical protein
MCYFHVKKACEDKLRGNAEKELILQDLMDLHSTLSGEEFDSKFSTMLCRWLVRSSEFALYFYHQWVQGNFVEWQIFCSAPGVASMNNAVESLNATSRNTLHATNASNWVSFFYGFLCGFATTCFITL